MKETVEADVMVRVSVDELLQLDDAQREAFLRGVGEVVAASKEQVAPAGADAGGGQQPSARGSNPKEATYGHGEEVRQQAGEEDDGLAHAREVEEDDQAGEGR